MNQIKKARKILPAEWAPQSGVQLTWPHANTDWNYMLNEVEECYLKVAKEIAKRELLLIVTPEVDRLTILLEHHNINMDNVRFFFCDSNDTWARDHGAITLLEDGKPLLYDFKFNGWGMKFVSNLDNQITHKAHDAGILQGERVNKLGFVLEGGSIESDGMGTILTTSECLLSENRNEEFTKTEFEVYFNWNLSSDRVLWLDHGYLEGDDTDSHIDTLARFCTPDTIAYVQCRDISDVHYPALKRMEDQLKTFRTRDGQPYKLCALPMAKKVEFDGERLPATYANFLIINGAVLVPTYNQPLADNEALATLKEVFPDREIVGIDCSALIKQHGSLHCITMQFPEGVLR